MRAGKRMARIGVQQGFTLLVLLGLIAFVGLGLMWAGPKWRDQVAKERERQWLRIGNLYAQALTAYIESSPGSLPTGPNRLESLLLDDRFVGTQRYLRSLYPDPLRTGMAWATVRDAKGYIVGVYSAAAAEPFINVAPPDAWLVRRPGEPGYAAWVFMARPHPRPAPKDTTNS